ncbi:response regulator transcription factor [Aggregatimonas sangjinii]|uniref:Response regulator transcription factor n=1 Tax=Aggregatimonas sangjinii TaxID=2583587 RepID=A0A5B7SYC0_9FLAO|nr:response regulator transcription factor [Aggregatimonas sangjinii]QCX01774.1 response regulator transcription factor [Aggregatimonas sangjinii]
MMRYLIIDDEHMAHDIIKGYCDLLPNMQLLRNCYDALEAFEYLTTHQVDLIFLDLNMPKLKGFDFLKTLSNPPKVIVTTAYQEHALEGYELAIVDYLLKPFGFERFLKAINKAAGSTANLPAVNSKEDWTSTKTIFLRENKKYVQVALETIYYIEAAGNYTKILSTEGSITVREKFSDVLASLETEGILQVHKSFAVATKHIKSIEGNRIHIANTTIPIGKMYKMNVTRLMGG